MYTDRKMKNTPEITTALAFYAAMLSNDKDFVERSLGEKKVIFELYRWGLFRFFGLSKDQEKEFSERFTETIIVPWCYPERRSR